MLRKTTNSITAFADALPATGGYSLGDMRLDIPDPATMVFKARLRGPAGSAVWARAWVSNPTDGTLAEAVSGRLTGGDEVTLTIKLACAEVPAQAYMRIESAPLCTEQVVMTDLGFQTELK